VQICVPSASKGKMFMAQFDKIVYLFQFILLILLVVFAWSV